MELHLVIEGGKDLAGQVERQLRKAIASGQLAPGDRLPPSRLLAAQLGLSRKTVAEAYARLAYEKLLEARVGAGTFVHAAVPEAAEPLHKVQLAGHATVERWRRMDSPLQRMASQSPSHFEFVGGAISRSLFPMEDWRRCALHALRQTALATGGYGDAQGLPALREAIARHIGYSRGVRCEAADLVVTNGAQQALDLVARVLVEPGALVAVEDPGYPQARLLFEAQGARVVGVPVDDEGLVAAQIPDGTRLIYTTPAHQFPLGLPMSLARRKQLLARAAALGAIVIEDDYDSEFRYEGRPTDALQSLDTQGLVAYIGTFSKVLTPELRLGYVVAPRALLDAVAMAKHLSDWQTTLLLQRALAKFIGEGYLLKQVRRAHAVLAARREKLLQRLATDLQPWFEPVPANAGFHLAVLCRRPVDVELLVKLARRVDVGLYPLAPFYHFSAPRQGLMLGYGAIETLDIDPSLDRVRDILREMA